MNKMKFIQDFTSKTNVWERQTLVSALVACLTPRATAKALDPLLKDPIVRRAILVKIKRDIEAGGCKPYHLVLAENLISQFPSLPANKRQTCGYFLRFLYGFFPEQIRRRIMNFFITSRYIAMRNHGYKILRKDWDIEYQSIITKSWEKHHDRYCALIIVNHFPEAFLEKEFETLEKVLNGEGGYARLCISVCEKKPALLQHIEKRDGVTFTYIMLKLGKTITEQQAYAIFDEFKFDNRISLFIWCLGRMKLWSVLENIAKNSDHLIEEKIAWYHKKHRLNAPIKPSSAPAVLSE